jgi:hypothetical protein
VRRFVVRLAAITVIGVFGSLPTLTRLHDRITASDQLSGFRFSKNLERPREKHGSDAVVSVSPVSVAPNLAPIGDVQERPVLLYTTASSAPTAVRAPPAV